MRLITVNAPAGEGERVVALAFTCEVKEVFMATAQVHRPHAAPVMQDVVNIQTATPPAKKFIEALLDAPFYEAGAFSFSIRHPEALFAASAPKEEVYPVTRPTTDVYQELYQYIEPTVSLFARVFLSAILVATGMMEDYVPLVIAGLLFLPYHHHLIGLALGGVMREWRFLRTAAWALVVSTLLIFVAAMCVALVYKDTPIVFQMKGSRVSGLVLSAIIGIAAGLASVDDAGRRELIGLAATAHISLYPAWIGLQVVAGQESVSKITVHLLSFAGNVVMLIVAAALTYLVSGMHGRGILHFIRGIRRKEHRTG